MSDVYQAAYDAIRARIGNCDIGTAVENAMCGANISFYFDQMMNAFDEQFYEHTRPSALFKPALSLAGIGWIAIYGDLPTGVVGIGDSPAAAMRDFDNNWLKKQEAGDSALAGKGKGMISNETIKAVGDLSPGYVLGHADVSILKEMARRLLAEEGRANANRVAGMIVEEYMASIGRSDITDVLIEAYEEARHRIQQLVSERLVQSPDTEWNEADLQRLDAAVELVRAQERIAELEAELADMTRKRDLWFEKTQEMVRKTQRLEAEARQWKELAHIAESNLL